MFFFFFIFHFMQLEVKKILVRAFKKIFFAFLPGWKKMWGWFLLLLLCKNVCWYNYECFLNCVSMHNVFMWLLFVHYNNRLPVHSAWELDFFLTNTADLLYVCVWGVVGDMWVTACILYLCLYFFLVAFFGISECAHVCLYIRVCWWSGVWSGCVRVFAYTCMFLLFSSARDGGGRKSEGIIVSKFWSVIWLL